MQCNIIIRRAFLNALGLLAYVFFVATIMTNGEKIFGKMVGVLGPVFILLFFVFSASVSASLVLGKPILMYLEGQKKEGIKMFFVTAGWIFIFFVLVGVIAVLLKR